MTILGKKDFDRLCEDLKNMCSPEEAKRRTKIARERLKIMMKKKFDKEKK